MEQNNKVQLPKNTNKIYNGNEISLIKRQMSLIRGIGIATRSGSGTGSPPPHKTSIHFIVGIEITGKALDLELEVDLELEQLQPPGAHTAKYRGLKSTTPAP